MCTPTNHCKLAITEFAVGQCRPPARSKSPKPQRSPSLRSSHQHVSKCVRTDRPYALKRPFPRNLNAVPKPIPSLKRPHFFAVASSFDFGTISLCYRWQRPSAACWFGCCRLGHATFGCARFFPAFQPLLGRVRKARCDLYVDQAARSDPSSVLLDVDNLEHDTYRSDRDADRRWDSSRSAYCCGAIVARRSSGSQCRRGRFESSSRWPDEHLMV